MPSLPSNIEALIFSRKRDIGGIIPDVVISEEHVDELEITRYPVDRGAPVADHAYKKPAVIHATFAWSDSSTLLNSVISNVMSGDLFKGIKTTKDIYNALLEKQAKREVFELRTGKRRYPAVIIQSLKTTSTVDTENALIVECTFQEVIFSTALSVKLVRKSKSPEQTATIQEAGVRSPKATKTKVNDHER